MQLTRAGRLRSEGLVHSIVPFEKSAEASPWIHDAPDRVVTSKSASRDLAIERRSPHTRAGVS